MSAMLSARVPKPRQGVGARSVRGVREDDAVGTVDAFAGGADQRARFVSEVLRRGEDVEEGSAADCEKRKAVRQVRPRRDGE